MTPNPLVSIITATHNAAEYLQSSINSVLNQTYKNFEYIIIDGASSDSTIEIIQKYQESITYWISEEDTGIYDAWNKGLKQAKGDWIAFIGADDQLLPDALQTYINLINSYPENTFDYISSRVKRVNPDGTIEGIVGKAWDWQEFKYRMTTAHPGSFHSKKIFDHHGLYKTNYKIVSDYELLLRSGKNLKSGFIDKVTAIMSTGTNLQKKDAIAESLDVLRQSKHLTLLQYYSHYVYASLGLFYRSNIRIMKR